MNAMSNPMAAFRCPSDPNNGRVSFAFGNSTGISIATRPSLSNYLASNHSTDTVRTGDGMFFANSNVSFRDVVDGTSNVIAIGERAEVLRNGIMGTDTATSAVYKGSLNTQSGCVFCTRGSRQQSSFGIRDVLASGLSSINNPATIAIPYAESTAARSFSSAHVGGAHFTLGDGAVRFIGENIDLNTLHSLIGIKDGKIIGEF
jgi:hypothetical protein